MSRKFTLRLNDHFSFNLDALVAYYSSETGLDVSLNEAVCLAIIDSCTVHGVYVSPSDLNQNKKDA